jgi:hypothetical protein
MYKKMLLLLCVVLMGSSALAVDHIWQGGAGGDWNVAGNWTNGLPAVGDNAKADMVISDFTTEGYQAYQDWFSGGNTEAQSIAMAMLNPSMSGWTNQTIETYATDVIPSLANISLGINRMSRATLNIRTNITVTNEFALGPDDYTAGNVNQYSGAVTVSSLRVPRRYHGEYNMYGGTVVAGEIRMPRNYSGWCMDFWLGKLYYDEDGPEGPAGPTQHYCSDGLQPYDWAESKMFIYGGTVTTNSLDVAAAVGNAMGVVTLADDGSGTLILTGNQMAKAHMLIFDSHQIRTVSGFHPIAVFDGTNTIITPEPATMLMLGLGAFGLIRRKN